MGGQGKRAGLQASSGSQGPGKPAVLAASKVQTSETEDTLHPNAHSLG